MIKRSRIKLDKCIINIGNEKYFKPFCSNIEERYILFLLKNNLIGSNINCFYFEKWNDTNNTLDFKQLMYNVLAKFEFLINDANNFSNILTFIYSKDSNNVNNPKKMIKLYFLLRTSIMRSGKLFISESRFKNYDVDEIKDNINLFLESYNKNDSEFMELLIKNTDEIKNSLISQYRNFEKIKKINLQEFNKFKKDFYSKRKILYNNLKILTRTTRLNKLKQKFNFEILTNKKIPTELSEENKNDLIKLINKTLVSWGMKLDPATRKNTFDVQLFSTKLYKKLILDVFSDLQLEGCKINITFQVNKNNEENNNVNYENNNISIDSQQQQQQQQSGEVTEKYIKHKKMEELKSFKFNFFKKSKKNKKELIKKGSVKFDVTENFNTINIIFYIIKEILDVYRFEIIDIYKKKGKKLPINEDLILNTKIKKINKIKSIDFNKIYLKIKSILKIEFNEKTFNSYLQLIKLLFRLNYSFSNIIRFVLRLKILGDKIQALEAKYTCSLIKDFDVSSDDIYVRKRILATHDRPLIAFSLIENNINFISSVKLNKKKMIFWNFGDAYSPTINDNSNLFSLPITQMYHDNIILNSKMIETNNIVFKNFIDNELIKIIHAYEDRIFKIGSKFNSSLKKTRFLLKRSDY